MKQHILLNGFVRTLKAGVNAGDAIDRLRAAGHSVEKCAKPPTLKTLEKWVSNGIGKSTDGCSCDNDGTCEHGASSWLIVLGMI